MIPSARDRRQAAQETLDRAAIELREATALAEAEFIKAVQSLCESYGFSIRPNGYEGSRIEVSEDTNPTFEVEQ